MIIFQYAYKKLPIENLRIPLILRKIMTHLRWNKQDGQNKNRAVLCSHVQDKKVSVLMKFEIHKKRYKSFNFEEIRNTQISVTPHFKNLLTKVSVFKISEIFRRLHTQNWFLSTLFQR